MMPKYFVANVQLCISGRADQTESFCGGKRTDIDKTLNSCWFHIYELCGREKCCSPFTLVFDLVGMKLSLSLLFYGFQEFLVSRIV